MLNVEGMRMRMSFAALMVGVAASLTVIGLIAVDGWPTPNVWLEPEAMVCAAAGDRDAATPTIAAGAKQTCGEGQPTTALRPIPSKDRATPNIKETGRQSRRAEPAA